MTAFSLSICAYNGYILLNFFSCVHQRKTSQLPIYISWWKYKQRIKLICFMRRTNWELITPPTRLIWTIYIEFLGISGLYSLASTCL